MHPDKRMPTKATRWDRAQIVIKLGIKCYVCKTTKNLRVHHMTYKFKSNRLIDQFEEKPNMFVLLCSRHHDMVTKMETLLANDDTRLVMPYIRYALRKNFLQLTLSALDDFSGMVLDSTY